MKNVNNKAQAIAEGYEISSDVYNRLCGIPLR